MSEIIEHTSAAPESDPHQPKPGLRFQLFNGSPVGELDDLMTPPEMPASVIESFELADIALVNEGFRTEPIFCDSDPAGFSLVNIRLAPEAILPSHTHEVDCLYYVLSGSIVLGRRTLGAGAGFFVPADQPYGYRAGSEGAAVLEFRRSTRFGMVITDGSASRWREIVDTAKRHNGWPGFRERVTLRPS